MARSGLGSAIPIVISTVNREIAERHGEQNRSDAERNAACCNPIRYWHQCQDWRDPQDATIPAEDDLREHRPTRRGYPKKAALHSVEADDVLVSKMKGRTKGKVVVGSKGECGNEAGEEGANKQLQSARALDIFEPHQCKERDDRGRG